MTGLIGHWPLTDDSAQDYANGNHGNLKNGPISGTSGKSGLQSINFPGNNEWVDFGFSDFYSVGAMAFWVKPNNFDANNLMGNGGTGEQSRTQVNTSSPHTVSYQRQAGGSDSTATSTSELKVGEWTHVVAQWDDNNEFIEIWIDGNLEGTSGYGAGLPSSGDGWRLARQTRNASTDNYFAGSFFDARLYDRNLSPLEIERLYERGAQAEAPSDGVARYEFEGDVTDSWGSNDGTNNGVSFVDGYYGQAGEFGGSDYVQTPITSVDTPITVSAWINADSLTANGSDAHLIGQYGGGSNDWYWKFQSGTLRARDDTASELVSPQVNLGRFIHVLWVRGDTESRLYYDGKLVDSQTGLSTNTFDANNLVIGALDEGSSGLYYDGLIDDLRIYPYALSAEQVSSLYHGWSDLAHPRDDGVAYYPLDGDATDAWGSNDGTNNGVTFERGVRGQGGDFDGSSDVTIGNFQQFTENDDFTFSYWVNQNSGRSDDYHIDQRDPNNGNDGLGIYYDSSNSQPLTAALDTSDGATKVSSNLLTDSWNHVVVTHKGSEIKMYVNGSSRDGPTTVSGSFTSDDTILLGDSNDYSGWNLSGSIDDVRIYDYALSPAAIHDLYQWGTRGRDMRTELVE